MRLTTPTRFSRAAAAQPADRKMHVRYVLPSHALGLGAGPGAMRLLVYMCVNVATPDEILPESASLSQTFSDLAIVAVPIQSYAITKGK